MTDDKAGAYVTLYKVLTTLVKVSAPFVPFMSEEIYQNLVVNIDKDALKVFIYAHGLLMKKNMWIKILKKKWILHTP